MIDQLFSLLASFVTLATVATVLSSAQLSSILRAFGDFFVGAINAAQTV